MINFTWLSQLPTKARTQVVSSIKNMTSFSWLAKMSTGRKPIFYGLLPPFSTILTIFAMSALIATGMAGWVWLTASASVGAFSLLPFLPEAMIGVLGFTLVNFWFNREINTFLLSSREVLDDFTFMKKENPTDLRKMVEHVRQELNVHFRKIYGDKHQDLPMPRISTFKEMDFKIVTVEGRNPGKAALFISTGALDYSLTRMNQRHLAALIQMELVKIYLRRGVTRTIAGMGADLLTNLKMVGQNWFGILAGPFSFFILLERSLKRSYEYEAAHVVVNCGRGVDLIDAIDKTVCPPLDIKPTYSEVRDQQQQNKREMFKGFAQNIIRPFTNWIDNNEAITDDKSGYRVLSLLDTVVRELGYHVRELWSSSPRSTRLKEYLKHLIKAPKNDIELLNTSMPYGRMPNMDPEFTLDNVYSNEMTKLHTYSKVINQALYQHIPEHSRYTPIAPQGSGKVLSKMDKLKERVKLMERYFEVNGLGLSSIAQENKEVVSDDSEDELSSDNEASNDQKIVISEDLTNRKSVFRRHK